MHEQDQLNKAIAQLYQTFAPYPPRRHMPACPHCVSQAEIIALTTVPLQSLTANSFGRYPFKAITTWGEAEDYRYFLPRLLELMPTDPYDFYMGIERMCEKLAYAHNTPTHKTSFIKPLAGRLLVRLKARWQQN